MNTILVSTTCYIFPEEFYIKNNSVKVIKYTSINSINLKSYINLKGNASKILINTKY